MPCKQLPPITFYTENVGVQGGGGSWYCPKGALRTIEGRVGVRMIKTFDRIFGAVINGKPLQGVGQDPRDLPTYAIPEAAAFLGIPERTLRSWFVGPHSIFAPAIFGAIPLLSFRDLVDAHVVQVARRYHKVPLSRIRAAIETARNEAGGGTHPLQDERIMVFARQLVRVEPGAGRRKRAVINLSKYGQRGIPSVIDLYTRRIVRDEYGSPIAIYPWRFWEHDKRKRPISIRPDVMSGRLVVAGTRVPVSLLKAETLSGKTVKALARDYRLPIRRVKEALSHLDTQAA